MSALLRLFLMTCARGSDWKIYVSQSLEDVHAHWMTQAELGQISGVLHVGFGRPTARAFNKVIAGYDGKLLATAGARFVMPHSSKFSEYPVDTVDGVPLYLVVDGWGYRVDDLRQYTVQPFNRTLQLTPESVQGQQLTATGWVSQFLAIAPEFEDALRQAVVHDEASYLARECELPAAVRTALGQFRFDSLVQDASDALEIVRFSPPWLRDQELERLPITVRLRNVFQMYSITVVSDLEEFSREDLFAKRNFGRRSYRDLGEALREGLRRGVVISDFSALSVSRGSSDASTADGPIRVSDLSSAVLSLGLVGNVVKTFNKFEERDRDILFGRMGFSGPPRTLEDLGCEHGVTRERIRQIEKRSLERVAANEIWDDVMRHRLGTILDSREDPLPLYGLEVVDDWFKGTSDRQDALAYLVENLCEKRFCVVKIGSIRFISRIDQETWAEKLKDARQLLESVVELHWSEDECRNAVVTFLHDQGKELAPLLWSEASRLCHFTGPVDRRVLTAYGRGLEQMVQVVLEESPAPLHTREVAQTVSDLAGKEIGESQIRNSVANVGVLLGRGTYGLRKHIPLSDSEIEEVVQITCEAIAEYDDNRQWHASELVDEVRERGGNFLGERLDKYCLNAALEIASDLKYLGRLVWTRPDAVNEQRVDLQDAVIEILRVEGGALTTRQINEQLSKFRGVNSTFQIWNRDPVLRVSRGLWGLNDRDVAVKRDRQPELIESVVSAIRKKGTGIHLDEIKNFIVCEPSLDPEAIFSIASLDNRVSVDLGRFAYLREWGDSRRLSLRDALDRLASQVPGPMNVSDVRDWLEFMTERKLEKSAVSHALSSAGMRYLGDGIWSIDEQDNDAEVEG